MAAGQSTFTWKHALKLHSSLSPFESPVPVTHLAFKGVKPVSWKRINVAGLLVTLYGIEELPSDPGDIVCLWLLHGINPNEIVLPDHWDSGTNLRQAEVILKTAWHTAHRLS
jgi:hypothetical protein